MKISCLMVNLRWPDSSSAADLFVKRRFYLIITKGSLGGGSFCGKIGRCVVQEKDGGMFNQAVIIDV
jgi:hypothetical protein